MSGMVRYMNNTLGDITSEYVYIQPVDERDMSLIGGEITALTARTGDTDFCVITVPVKDWNSDLTPWEAAPVFGSKDFGSGAADTLKDIEGIVEQFESKHSGTARKYIICGYSLAGLFALWSVYNTDIFEAAVAASASVWYPGWKEYAAEHEAMARAVYLSLGDKEEKTKNKVMSTVGNAMRAQYELLQTQGIRSVLEWNEGNHFADSDIRVAKGMAWVRNELKHMQI